jgi:hypothetical protein
MNHVPDEALAAVARRADANKGAPDGAADECIRNQLKIF